jgi:hypothetical protein
LNIYQERIFARKCTIKEVSAKEAKIFLTDNHLQGYTVSKISLGLYHNNELVMLQTFGKSRFKKDYNELIRMCSKLNTVVIGGASRLFKHFVENYNESNYVQTFADLEYSNGEAYSKLGFQLSHITTPNYHYYAGGVYFNRMGFQKKKFNIPINITEKQYFIDLGYRIYWDAGQKVFTFNV